MKTDVIDVRIFQTAQITLRPIKTAVMDVRIFLTAQITLNRQIKTAVMEMNYQITKSKV